MSSSPTDVLVDVTMPQMGVSVAEGTVVAWRVEPGDRIEAEATICEISTDKIDTEVPSPATGVVAEILVPIGETVEVGTVMARIATGAALARPCSRSMAAPPVPRPLSRPSRSMAVTSAPRPPKQNHHHPPPAARNGDRRYSPVVQRIAAEHGIDLSQVPGTGRGGRVRKQDVLAFVDAAPVEEPPLHIESPYRPDPVAPPAPAVAPAVGGGELSRMRRQIGEHMKRSLDTAATCTTWIEVDMSRVEAARARLGVTALAFVRGRRSTRSASTRRSTRGSRARRYTQHTRRKPRDRGVARRRRPDRPGHPARARAVGRGARRACQGHRAAGAVAAADSGRRAGRHVHDHQPRAVRVDHGDADHQPAAGRDPRSRGGGEARRSW